MQVPCRTPFVSPDSAKGGKHVATPYYRLIKGTFVIVDYEPDGDSVRFIPDTPDLLTAEALPALY